MKPGIAPYRAGEQVWVNRGGVFLRASLVSNARRVGHDTEIDIGYPDGTPDTTFVGNVYRDGPEIDAWMTAFAAEGPLLRALTEVCQRQGFTYGGKACRATPEWTVYEANQARIRAAGGAVRAVHPYAR